MLCDREGKGRPTDLSARDTGETVSLRRARERDKQARDGQKDQRDGTRGEMVRERKDEECACVGVTCLDGACMVHSR